MICATRWSNLAKRVRTQDIQMFVVSVAIQSETGGSLADILEGPVQDHP